ncbi:EEF1A lysine methyltransferase 1 isoform X2 [Balaenoptera acutorostrata]|uniref:EEF1A lysine methyltransferase 1 n=1 Tax=Balaenoptera acutorostrata TaxID=9767 RepID=A0ABM3SGF6_BALAC|nr:EEF1A lysine methyltransferase 1 isoform X2 [Balaenoptera acutorostrata]
MSNSEDEDLPQLSSHALAALQEFYAEQKQYTDLGGDDKYNIGIIEENWLSQFWYTPETALHLAEEAVAAAGEGGRIACVSAPSVYQKLRELHREDFSICIFEYDHRFAIYGEEFIFYDYNNPVDLPEKIAAHSFDIVIADPPYLSEECLRKTSETIKYLTRGKILLCTGRCRIGNTPPMTLNKALPRSAPQSPYLYSGAEMLPFSQGWREVSGMMPGTRGPALGECTRSVTCTHQRQ